MNLIRRIFEWWDYRRGKDIPPGWPLRAVMGQALNDALAADIGDRAETLEDDNA